ncbi:hypothetical protein PV327_001126 [Microctonus hyperodae]|uniref:Uncharacterized protein n=1 Tax=Microctonus hyperodae TaxID=165561 RepID=A0AA39G809_MICHY|nr:hypothetical protein PV327_001126 [Microctonus hyperodae]
MNLRTISIIILDIFVSQVICVTIKHESHERYNRVLRNIDISVDKLKELIRNGNAQLNIPIFDPYHIEKFKTNFNENGLRIDGEVRNINLQGLSDIENIDTDISFWKRKITLSLTLPEIIVTGDYLGITQNLSGNYEAFVENITATATIQCSFFFTSPSVKNVKVKMIEKVKISANGMKDNKPLETNIFRSQTTSETALKFCNRVHITNFLENTLSEILKKIIEKKSLSQIKSLLV